jgi:hypothetical protein
MLLLIACRLAENAEKKQSELKKSQALSEVVVREADDNTAEGPLLIKP